MTRIGRDGNPPGTPASRKAAKNAASTPAPVTPLPDETDAAVRTAKAKQLQDLLKMRGRSYTLMSGRTGDNSITPLQRPSITRGG